jgi:hypothetical protein
LRWLAIVCIVYAALSLAGQAIALAVEGWRYYSLSSLSNSWRRLNAVTSALSTVAQAALLFGGVGLLKWRRWSRVVLWLAAACMIGFSLVSNVGWFIIYSDQISKTTTRPVGLPVWFYGFTTFVMWFTSSAFPAIVLWVMSQREVKNLWAQQGAGGFEVVPMARAVGESAP